MGAHAVIKHAHIQGVTLSKITDRYPTGGVIMVPSEGELDRRRGGEVPREGLLGDNDLDGLWAWFALASRPAQDLIALRGGEGDSGWVTYEPRAVVEGWRDQALRAGGYEMAAAWGMVLRGEA